MNSNTFDNLVLNNYLFLHPVAISLTKDTEDAKDLIQETLFRAMANKEKYNNGTNIKAWLYTIMRNIFINNYRRKKKFMKVSSETPQDFYLFKTNRIAINDGVVNNNMREIKGAINNLPEIFRMSFELHYIGYKYQEIADTLKEPLGTIKSRIHFARKMLASNIVRN